MGWFTENGVHTKQDLIENIKRNPEPFAVLGIQSVSAGLWVLYKHPTEGRVFITLYLVSIEGNELHYKSVTESAGPCEYDCPMSFINQSNCTSNYAVSWRQKVRDFWAAKVQKKAKAMPGAIFRLDDQLYKLSAKFDRAKWLCQKLDVQNSEPLPPYLRVSSRVLNTATFL